MKAHQIIYADPPWTYRDKCHSGKRGASYKYALMTQDDLIAMRPFIDSISAPDCLLAMWWTPPLALEALELMEQWGFELKTMKGFTWHKITKNKRDFFGMGNWTRANTEDCLFATRGKPKRVSAAVPQLIHAPRREHSRKPDEARDRLVKLMGDVPRIELFARQRVAGWEAWGDEIK
jgi:N6-adenosine-specific RNA methylase IME4